LDVSAAAAAAVAMVAVRSIGEQVDEESAASAALELEVVMGRTAGRQGEGPSYCTRARDVKTTFCLQQRVRRPN
jgi:hypothetical protein